MEDEVIVYLAMAAVFQVLALVVHKEKDAMVAMVLFGLVCIVGALCAALGINLPG